MRPYQVNLSLRSRRDIRAIHSYITRQSSRQRAGRFITRILESVHGLGSSPHRGNLQPHLGPGFHLIGMERRVSILFEVDDTRETVEIISILYGGRQL